MTSYNKQDICLIGAGGHARSLVNLIESEKFSIVGLLDGHYNPKVKEYVCGYEVIGGLKNLPKSTKVILSMGNVRQRKKVFDEFETLIIRDNLLHRSAFLEKNVSLGISNQIFAKTYLNSYSSIGSNNIINTNAILEHECEVGNHNHLSINSAICGRAKIGNCCFIGAGAIIKDKVSIVDGVTIGANSTVLNDIDEPGVYVGTPAKKIK